MKTCVTCKHYYQPFDRGPFCTNKKITEQDPVTGRYIYYPCVDQRVSQCGREGKYHEGYKDKPYKDLEVKDIITGPAWTWTEVTVITILLIIVAVSLYSAGHF